MSVQVQLFCALVSLFSKAAVASHITLVKHIKSSNSMLKLLTLDDMVALLGGVALQRWIIG